MSRDDEPFDPSDWLVSQFDESAEPEKPAAKPASEDESTEEASPGDSPAAPRPAAPVANAGGGFNWGLRPSVTPESEPSPPLQVPPQPQPSTPSADVPTQAMSLDDIAAVAEQEEAPVPPPSSAPPASTDMPTQAYTTQAWDPGPRSPDDPTSSLDTLFGDHRFEEYEGAGVLRSAPPLAADPLLAPRPPRQHLSLTTLQKTLMWIAGALVAVLALVALFVLGERLGAASATATPAPGTTTGSSAPAQSGPTSGLASPGTHSWKELNGGECLQPYSSAWAVSFTVVDCGSKHAGQVLSKGTLPDSSGVAYPTGAQFSTEIKPLCTSPKVIDYDGAKAVTDLQVAFTYPASAAEWSAGDRTYYCFVSRASGDALPGSLAVPK